MLPTSSIIIHVDNSLSCLHAYNMRIYAWIHIPIAVSERIKRSYADPSRVRSSHACFRTLLCARSHTSSGPRLIIKKSAKCTFATRECDARDIDSGIRDISPRRVCSLLSECARGNDRNPRAHRKTLLIRANIMSLALSARICHALAIDETA